MFNMISGLKKSLLIFGILILFIALVNLPNIKFGAESLVFFSTDPIIRFFVSSSELFDIPAKSSVFKFSARPDDALGIYGHVLKVPPSVSFGSIIVSAGADDGVIPGMKAILPDDIFVVFVEEVFKSYSRIRLLSSFGKVEQVRINEIGIVSEEGMGGVIFKIELPRDIALAVGEPIMIQADRPYLAGFIEEINAKGIKPLVEVKGILPFNVSELNYVFIVP